MVLNKIVDFKRRFLLKKRWVQVLLIFLLISSSLLATTLAFEYYKDNKEANSTNKETIVNEDKDFNTEKTDRLDSEPSLEEDISEIVEEEEIVTTTKPKQESPPPQETTPQEGEEAPAPPPESPSAVVAFYADNQSDTEQEDIIHQRTVNNILASGANPVFHAGDLMEDGTEDSLNRFNTVTATLRSSRTFYAALGNNDRKIGDSSTPSQLFLDNFVFLNNEQWYSVNYGNLHLVVLDSAFSASSQSQISWLISDLQNSNSQSRITGVMFHHPTFISNISQYLVSYGADFVISGHNHSYQHSIQSGINTFVLSGQPSLGHMIAKIYSDKVIIKVYNNSNGLVDTVEFTER